METDNKEKKYNGEKKYNNNNKYSNLNKFDFLKQNIKNLVELVNTKYNEDLELKKLVFETCKKSIFGFHLSVNDREFVKNAYKQTNLPSLKQLKQ